MRMKLCLSVCVSALALIVTCPSYAQDRLGGVDGPTPSSEAAADPAVVVADAGDIVVTARRRSESLQNVPQTVNAVNGETLRKLAITQFQDVTSVVPGLSLGNSSVLGGGLPAPSIRGISYDASASPNPTVDIYFNEVPTDAQIAYSAIYDIADVEVLRGPQGTLRGRTAPSGAITMSTRRPDLDTVGGYVNALGTDRGSINAQGAFNVPLVREVLGLRVAGLIDQNSGDFVTSANKRLEPYRYAASGRATLAFKPADNFDATLTYQYLDQRSLSFFAVEGPGAAGGVVVTAPAGYNGPPLSAGDRLGVGDDGRRRSLQSHQLVAQINWSIAGQRVSYVGGYTRAEGLRKVDTDFANFFPGAPSYQTLANPTSLLTQEFRISSQGDARLIDYTIGYFYSRTRDVTSGDQTVAYLPGAFGAPNADPNPLALNSAFTLPARFNFATRQTENAFFGSVTLHATPRTELTVGGRYITSRANNIGLITLQGGAISTQIGLPCAAAGLGSTYGEGYCDVPIPPAASPVTDSNVKDVKRPFVYSASLSHRLSDAVLAYASVASSWRRGGSNTFANGDNDPVLASLIFLPPEKSTSYEVGLKTNLFDRRLRLNVSAFYQKFDGLLFQQSNIPYLSSNGVTTAVDTIAANSTARAVVKGVDVDLMFRATSFWTIGGGFSYADGRVDNDKIPCLDSDFDGVPDIGTPTVAGFRAAGTHIAYCRSNQSVSRNPIWSATAQMELWAPIGKSEGYVRGLVNVFARNPRQDPGLVVPAYGIMNFYAGLRSPGGEWDVSVFARNLTNTGVRTSRSTDFVNESGDPASLFGVSGYRLVTYTPPREIGVQVRFAFGSR